jgi:hypothetical protein
MCSMNDTKRKTRLTITVKKWNVSDGFINGSCYVGYERILT